MKTIIKAIGLVFGIVVLLCLASIVLINNDSQEETSERNENQYQSTQMDMADEHLISKLDFSVNNRKITAVDLGLPSGTKWADRNVGASTPCEYGNLYRYGNPQTKLNGSNNRYAEESSIIGTKNDVAKSLLGGRWVTPSVDQIKELLQYCKSALITIKGKKVVAVIGPNDKFILFPLVGCMFNFGRSESEMWGLYEAGNLVGGNAVQFVVDDEGKADIMDSQLPGYYGCAIRAVENMK